MVNTIPRIQEGAEFQNLVHKFRRKPCRVTFLVKYLLNPDWVTFYLWLGYYWTRSDISEKAYEELKKQRLLLQEEEAQIEEARLSSIKLI